MKTIFALLLIAHGLIVAGQSGASFRPTGGIPNPAWLNFWPAGLGQSWLLSAIEQILPVRLGGLVWLAAGLALIAAGLGLLGILVPAAHWRTLALVGSLLSLAMLLVYLHPFYAVGLSASAALFLALTLKTWPILARIGL